MERPYVVGESKELWQLVRQVEKALDPKSPGITFDNVYLDLRKLNDLTKEEFERWFEAFKILMKTKYPDANVSFDLPEHLKDPRLGVEAKIKRVRNFTVSPVRIDVLEDLEELKKDPGGVTHVVLSSYFSYEVSQDIELADKIRELLTFAEPENIQGYHSQGFSVGFGMFEGREKDITAGSKSLSEDDFIGLSKTVAMCYSEEVDLGLVERIYNLLETFKGDELSRAKQEIEKCITKVRRTSGEKQILEYARLRGMFIGTVKAIAKYKYLPKQLEFINVDDESRFITLILLASVSESESIRKIPQLIADGKYKPGKTVQFGERTGEEIEKEILEKVSEIEAGEHAGSIAISNYINFLLIYRQTPKSLFDNMKDMFGISMDAVLLHEQISFAG